MSLHRLVADHNGDPSCFCGYQPAGARHQMDACRLVRLHAAAPPWQHQRVEWTGNILVYHEDRTK